MADNNTLESLEIEVKHSSQGAASEIDETTAALKRTKAAASEAVNVYSRLSKEMAQVKAANAGGNNRNREISAAFGKEQIARQKEIDAITEAMFSDGKRAKPEPDYEAANRLVEQSTAADLLRMRIEALTEKLAGLASSEKNSGEQIAATTAKIQKLKAELDGLNNDAGETTKKTGLMSGGFGKLLKSVGRVGFYRVIRGALSAITQGFSEGLQNAYAFSAAVDGPLAAALDGLSSNSLTMKNQLGSAFGSLLTAVIPMLQTLISWVTAAANALAQLFSFLGGGGTQLKAKDTSSAFQEIGGGAGGAAEQVKELRNQLMGFDEINRLEPPNDSSGGGGGGGGGNIGDMFEEVAIDEKWKALGERLRPIIDGIKQMFRGLVEFVAGILTGDFEQAMRGLGNLVEGFADTVSASLGLVQFTFNMFVDGVQGLIDELFAWLSQKTGINLSGISETINRWIDEVQLKINVFLLGLRHFLTGSGEFLNAVVNGDFGAAIEALKKMSEGAEIMWASTTVSVEKDTGEMGAAVSDEVSNMESSVTGYMDAISTEVSSSISSASGGYSSGWAGISYETTAATSRILASVQTWAANVRATISGALAAFAEAQMNMPVGVLGSGTRGNNMIVNGVVPAGEFAEGGYPSTGSLFWAREAGPEMVGTIGGRTAVANNSQIVAGIRSGVYEAVSAAMRGHSNDRPVELYLDGKLIADSTTRYQRNALRATGG